MVNKEVHSASRDNGQKQGGRLAPFALGFRPFFLVAGWFGIILMIIFLLAYYTHIWHYNYYDFSIWHGHEMLFGYTVAVIAGFLLTAVRNWTGVDTPVQGALAGLLLLWLVPRLFQVIPVLPPVVTALADMLFLPVLAFVLAGPIWKARQMRNYSVPVILVLIAAANGMVHLEILGLADDSAATGLRFGINLVIVLIALIAGRVIPFFVERGLPGVVIRRQQMLEKISMYSLYGFVLTELFFPQTLIATAVALFAAVVHGFRMRSWYHNRIWSQPMLWVLLLAYGWLVFGLTLHALSNSGLLASLPAIHALTVGAIGMFTLGMMARVSLGHTGRSIRSLPRMFAAVLLLFAAALFRVVSPILMASENEWFMAVSGFSWVAAMFIFAAVYSPILIRERADGKPG